MSQEEYVQDLGTNDFKADPNETITIKVRLTKNPFSVDSRIRQMGRVEKHFACAWQPDGTASIHHAPGPGGEVDFNVQLDRKLPPAMT